MTVAPPPPLVRLTLGVTGHREANTALAAYRDEVEGVLTDIFSAIDDCLAREAETLGPLGPVRLHSLLACGVDQMAADGAVRRRWDLVAPLPFGRALNLAINAQPHSREDAEALLSGGLPRNSDVARRADAIRSCYDKARVFELAEKDESLASLFLSFLDTPADLARAQAFSAHCSERVAIAGRVLVEQSDFLIAVWDGATRNHIGGTGHTIAIALEMGTPVVCIDPAQATEWRVLTTPESLTSVAGSAEDRAAGLAQLVRRALRPMEGGSLMKGAKALSSEAWHARSSRFWRAYRRIEALFGGEGKPFQSLVRTYETPEQIGTGSGAAFLETARAMSANDPEFPAQIERETLQRFAWADGISSYLSDSYRGGMIANFLLSTLAIAAGIAYQPLGLDSEKWAFALVEFLLLCSILLVTALGSKWRWHKRWFETRRVAEYFRHAPILLLLGVSRSAGRWPKGADTSWPEYYARHGLRAPGLPHVAMSVSHLRLALERLLDAHVLSQRDYHVAKAKRLTTVHHRLDRLSERLFQLAVLSVSTYLVLAGAAEFHLVDHEWLHAKSKLFTFLGVLFPTLGASIAGMRYFGDFERFAAISEVTAEKLEAVHQRIGLLLAAPDAGIDYRGVSELAHAIDDIVVGEIENWQAVFGGKQITVPV